jgi:hypothetical protein
MVYLYPDFYLVEVDMVFEYLEQKQLEKACELARTHRERHPDIYERILAYVIEKKYDCRVLPMLARDVVHNRQEFCFDAASYCVGNGSAVDGLHCLDDLYDDASNTLRTRLVESLLNKPMGSLEASTATGLLLNLIGH